MSRELEPKAANCANGYLYDDACDECAKKGLAGDYEHEHCYCPTIENERNHSTEWSYSILHKDAEEPAYVLNFITDNKCVLEKVLSILNEQIDKEKQHPCSCETCNTPCDDVSRCTKVFRNDEE